MAKRLMSRTTKTKAKEAPEPETYTEKGPVNVAVREESFLGKCKGCNFFQANSRADDLCLDCHQKKHGYVLDEKQNRYIKEGKNYG